MVKIDFKLVILGGFSVGKSSLMQRIVHDNFIPKGPPLTIGAAFTAKPVISKNGKTIVIGIWDTAGLERYEAMSKIYYRDATAAIICYSICERASWEKMKFWINELRENEKDCQIYLCGTKRDLVDDALQNREVDFEMASKYAQGIQSKIFETSSKTGANIAEMFQMIVEDYIGGSGNMEQFEREEIVSLDNTSLTTSPSRKWCFETTWC